MHLLATAILTAALAHTGPLEDTFTFTPSFSGRNFLTQHAALDAVQMAEQRIWFGYTNRGYTVLVLTLSKLDLTQNAAGNWDVEAEWDLLYSDETGPPPY